MTKQITFHDDGPDALGRRHFSLEWTDEAGDFRPWPHPIDGKPVGYRRGQFFHAVPPDMPLNGTLNETLRLRGYTTQKCQPGTKDIIDMETGEVVLRSSRAHQVWAWLTD